MLITIELLDFFSESPIQAFALTLLFFSFLYFFCAGLAFLISRSGGLRFKINPSRYSLNQIAKEIQYSLISILIFSGQAILIQQAFVYRLVEIKLEFSFITFLAEVIVLFFWNELHFYCVHWLLHRKWWFKNVHFIHHQSHQPTPFSIYSFSWVEAFLLGSVIFPPLFSHSFQVASLLSLPILSILHNVVGHCDYDFFPNKKINHWLRASYRHSLHHSKVSGNFGFQLSVFDRIFKTNINP